MISGKEITESSVAALMFEFKKSEAPGPTGCFVCQRCQLKKKMTNLFFLLPTPFNAVMSIFGVVLAVQKSWDSTSMKLSTKSKSPFLIAFKRVDHSTPAEKQASLPLIIVAVDMSL